MLGDNIRYLREKMGLSIKDLSKLTGITSAYLSMLENNKRKNPSTEMLQKIANQLNIDINQLFVPDESTSEEINVINNIKEVIDENNLKTIAAHFDGEKFTNDDLEDIEKFIKFIVSKRK